MYDIYGSYTIGFVVTGVGNIAAASILAFIPWLKKEAKQSKKNYLNASVCEITRTIVPWQSPTPSLGVNIVVLETIQYVYSKQSDSNFVIVLCIS